MKHREGPLPARRPYLSPWAAWSVLAVLLASSCRAPEAPAPAVAPAPAPYAPPVVRPDDYLVVLDNSGSIKGDERVILREAVKVLADVVLPRDRVGVITFDEDAELLLSVEISGPQERQALRDAVDTGVDFSGRFSDLRAGLALAARERGRIFRGPEADPSIVLISDGLLEPADGNASAALDELLGLATRELGSCAFYPIGLGDAAIHAPIAAGRAETGETLLRDQLTARGGRFFHATSFDLVHASVLEVFQVTKDAAATSEQPASFAADESVERVVLAVPKIGPAGEELARTRDLALDAPGHPGILATSPERPLGPDQPTRLLWNSSYRYFDLITVEQPAPGMWSLRAPEAVSAETAVIAISHTKVLHEPVSSFFVDELRAVPAWVYDDRSGKALERGLAVSALVRRPDGVGAPLSVTMPAVEDRFVLRTADLVDVGLTPGEPWEYSLRFRGTDGFFLRQTPWWPLAPLPSLVQDAGGSRRVVQWVPGRDTGVELKLAIDRTRADLPGLFGSQPPAASAHLLRRNEETGQDEPWSDLDLALVQSDSAFTYTATPALPAGDYSVAYTLRGADDQGRERTLDLRPERVTVVAHGPWVLAGAIGALLALALVAVRWSRGALDLQVQVTRPQAGDVPRKVVKHAVSGVRGAVRFEWAERAGSGAGEGPAFEVRKRVGISPLAAPAFHIRPLAGQFTFSNAAVPPSGAWFPAFPKGTCTVGTQRFEITLRAS